MPVDISDAEFDDVPRLNWHLKRKPKADCDTTSIELWKLNTITFRQVKNESKQKGVQAVPYFIRDREQNIAETCDSDIAQRLEQLFLNDPKMRALLTEF